MWRSGRAMSRSWVVVLVVVGAVLVGQARWVTQRSEVAGWAGNTLASLNTYDRTRSDLVTDDGQRIATTTRSDRPGLVRYGREYPGGELYAPIAGYRTIQSGGRGAEQAYWDDLVGVTARDLELSVDSRLQSAAREALGDREGAVVALEPGTGRVLALWSNPTFDPSGYGAPDLGTQERARAADVGNPATPHLNRALDDNFPPGSTMKLITAAAALEAGTVTRDTAFIQEFERGGIPNAGGASCGGDLVRVVASSCNTAFVRMGEGVGSDRLSEMAARFGFDTSPLDDTVTESDALGFVLPTVRSRFPRPASALELANQSIGQGDVRATPLQMAVVASTIANSGRQVLPVLRDRGGSIEVISERVAALLQDAMEETVASGTGRETAVDGVRVGVKTGTAQVDADRVETHAWVVGYAGRPGESPGLAFCVFVRADESRGTESGGAVAGPVARELVEAWERTW